MASAEAEQRLYRALYERFRASILGGELPAGARLPSTRHVAAEAGVSRNTVLMAYEQLVAEGYVVPRTGRGTFVADFLPQRRPAAASARSVAGSAARSPVRSPAGPVGPVPPGDAPPPSLSAYGRRLLAVERPADPAESFRHDFRYGLPALSDLPRKTWTRAWNRVAARHDLGSLGYGPPEGLPALRQGLVAYLKRLRAVSCGPESLIVVNGARQALDLIGRALIDPGDLVALEEPHYPGAREGFQVLGASLVAIPVDAEGIEVGRLAALARPPKLVFVTPSHQLPLGVVMPVSRRLALLDWAARTGALIVEDDYNSEFRYAGRPIEALQALDRDGRVIYVGTLSKTLYPALRLGYVAAAPPLARLLAQAKYLADRHTPTAPQSVLAEFIRSGQFDRHLRRARLLSAARRDALLGALRTEFGEAVTIQGAEAGLHLVAWFRGLAADRADALVAQAARRGVGLSSLSRYYLGQAPCAGVILGYANQDPPAIRAGIAALRAAMAPELAR
ncbi:PLP-dependent aminotransferase family protein [Roseomonas sp. NAR14]|uniref:PLP-dependent aminotransferase family protein n=1 Tax=Roseomonas acroporae TaxID=2937791 RepID=A0A9X1Y5G3_9PROT|nr:PLP-dependent aminotransferase family protein [Roseomonas acroporae]MCK8784314.1 PLP-dependent aminotransferase family protein [Roseomonas acroporae]